MRPADGPRINADEADKRGFYSSIIKKAPRPRKNPHHPRPNQPHGKEKNPRKSAKSASSACHHPAARQRKNPRKSAKSAEIRVPSPSRTAKKKSAEIRKIRVIRVPSPARMAKKKSASSACHLPSSHKKKNNGKPKSILNHTETRGRLPAHTRTRQRLQPSGTNPEHARP